MHDSSVWVGTSSKMLYVALLSTISYREFHMENYYKITSWYREVTFHCLTYSMNLTFISIMSTSKLSKNSILIVLSLARKWVFIKLKTNLKLIQKLMHDRSFNYYHPSYPSWKCHKCWKAFLFATQDWRVKKI